LDYIQHHSDKAAEYHATTPGKKKQPAKKIKKLKKQNKIKNKKIKNKNKKKTKKGKKK